MNVGSWCDWRRRGGRRSFTSDWDLGCPVQGEAGLLLVNDTVQVRIRGLLHFFAQPDCAAQSLLEL